MLFKSIKDLPAHVMRHPEKLQRQWMNVFNSVFEKVLKEIDDKTGISDKKEAEARAIIAANAVLGRAVKNRDSEFDTSSEGIFLGSGMGEFIHDGMKNLIISDKEMNLVSERLLVSDGLCWGQIRCSGPIMLTIEDLEPHFLKHRINDLRGMFGDVEALFAYLVMSFNPFRHPFGVNNSEGNVFLDEVSMATSNEFARWTRAFINNLPDAAFAVVLSGGKKDDEGKTVPRSLRKLPHHGMDVKSGKEHNTVDIPHLRNALARINQTNMPSVDKKYAQSHLDRHADVLLKSRKKK